MTSNLKEEEFRKHLRQEFINRIDDIMQFNDLRHDSIKTIVEIQMNEVFSRLADQGIKVKINEDVKSYLMKNGYDPEYGARPIHRIIRREILAGLSKYLLQHQDINQVNISMDKESVQFNDYKQEQQAA